MALLFFGAIAAFFFFCCCCFGVFPFLSFSLKLSRSMRNPLWSNEGSSLPWRWCGGIMAPSRDFGGCGFDGGWYFFLFLGFSMSLFWDRQEAHSSLETSITSQGCVFEGIKLNSKPEINPFCPRSAFHNSVLPKNRYNLDFLDFI